MKRNKHKDFRIKNRAAVVSTEDTDVLHPVLSLDQISSLQPVYMVTGIVQIIRGYMIEKCEYCQTEYNREGNSINNNVNRRCGSGSGHCSNASCYRCIKESDETHNVECVACRRLMCRMDTNSCGSCEERACLRCISDICIACNRLTCVMCAEYVCGVCDNVVCLNCDSPLTRQCFSCRLVICVKCPMRRCATCREAICMSCAMIIECSRCNLNTIRRWTQELGTERRMIEEHKREYQLLDIPKPTSRWMPRIGSSLVGFLQLFVSLIVLVLVFRTRA